MEAFWRQTLVDGAMIRAWMTNIGRREAYHRMAHLLCEWLVRLRAVGLVEGFSCELPMTQGELGDAMGISTVHVNRVLQNLRAAGLIVLRGSQLEVLDWEQLQRVGDFDASYLHQDDSRDAA